MISKHASLQPITQQSQRCPPSPSFKTRTVTQTTSWQDYYSTDGFGMEQVEIHEETLEKISTQKARGQHESSKELHDLLNAYQLDQNVPRSQVSGRYCQTPEVSAPEDKCIHKRLETL